MTTAKAKETITFKEIAIILDLSVKCVQANENLWGLKPHRANGFKKPIRFWREKALRSLISAGLLSQVPS